MARQSRRLVIGVESESQHFEDVLDDLLPSGPGRPSCLAFCPQGERHDLGLLMGALALGCAGWQTVVLGADTPSASTEMPIEEIRPELLLIAASARRPVTRLLERWSPPRHGAVIAGGPGFRDGDEIRLGGPIHKGPYADVPGTVAAATRHSGHAVAS
ncbi:MAG: hypothetical protein M3083_24835 [Actinomycetota bacterium]|nr:hypothetical protein [Actinomycetota bacterium]MDQ6947799.1 hypothetical protein [Actinomycetota bacterium]